MTLKNSPTEFFDHSLPNNWCRHLLIIELPKSENQKSSLYHTFIEVTICRIYSYRYISILHKWMSSTKTTLSHFFSDCNNFQEGWISLTSSSVMIFYGSSFVSLVFQSGSEQFSMHHSMKNTAVTMMMRQQQHNSNNNEFVIQVIRVCSIFSKKKKN